MKNKMSDSEFLSASDFLYDNYDKVLNEYNNKHKERNLTYRIARGPTALGVVFDILFIFILVISYILYKSQLPYELILFSLIGIWMIYRFCKLIVMPELDILGDPDVTITKSTNLLSAASSLSLYEPSHTVYIEFIKTFKLISYSVCFAILVLSTSVYYFLEGDSTLIIFIIVFLAYLVYYIVFSINMLIAINKRDKALEYELIAFAKKIKENSL